MFVIVIAIVVLDLKTLNVLCVLQLHSKLDPQVVIRNVRKKLHQILWQESVNRAIRLVMGVEDLRKVIASSV